MSETTYFSSPDSLSSDISELYVPMSCHNNDYKDLDDDLETTISIQSSDRDESYLLSPIKIEKSVFQNFQTNIPDDPFLNDVIKEDELLCDDYVTTTKRSSHSDPIQKGISNSDMCCSSPSASLIVNYLPPSSTSNFHEDTEYCSASSTEFDFDFPFEDNISPLSSGLYFSSKRPFSCLDSALDDFPDTHTKMCKLDRDPIKIEKTAPIVSIKAEKIVKMSSKTTNVRNLYSSKQTPPYQQPTKTMINCKRDPETGSIVARTNLHSPCDRRKTKHHKVLSEIDWDCYEEELMPTSEFCVSRSDPNPSIPTHSKFPNNLPHSYLYNSPHLYTKSRFTPITKSTKSSTLFVSPAASSLSSSTFRHNFSPCKYTANPSMKPLCSTSSLNSSYCSLSTSSSSTISTTNLSSGSSVASTNSDSSVDSSVSKMPPEPLRMGKKVNKRGQRFSLWQFLMFLLDSCEYNNHSYSSHSAARASPSTGIKWVNRNNGIFHILDSKQVACLWGKYKERKDKMTYDSLARSLRHYYKKNLMAKINNRRLVYQIAQECLVWSTDTFMKSRHN